MINKETMHLNMILKHNNKIKNKKLRNLKKNKKKESKHKINLSIMIALTVMKLVINIKRILNLMV